MPEFTLKEVRLPELHLPEIKRDEIVRSISGVHLPDVDVAKARRVRINAPALTLTSSDIGKLLAAVAALARFVRPAPSRGRWLTARVGRHLPSPIARIVQPRRARSRRPVVFGAVVVAAFVAWAVLRRPEVRRRIGAVARRARERFGELRTREVRADEAPGEPIAISIAETIGDRTPAFEESTAG